MKPAQFSYHAPRTLSEATDLLEKLADAEPRVLAGGQSLVPTMALRLARPGHLVDINGVEGLDAVQADEAVIRIGALVRHTRFESPEGLGNLGPLLTSISRHIAHYPIRQRGTFCGSLAHADPASEWCLATAVLEGVMTATSTNGDRQIEASDYFQGIMTTALDPGEILTAVTLRQINATTKWGFEEFSMRAGDFAVAMSLVAFDLDGGSIANARIGVGGIEAFPRKLSEAELLLNGSPPSGETFEKAGNAVANAVEPLDDWQASAGDRRDLARALVKRTLHRALGEQPL